MPDFVRVHAWCKACEAKPKRYRQERLRDWRSLRITIECHGAEAHYLLTPEMIEDMADGEGGYRKIGEWLENLFTNRATPDVMELIQYNKAPWSIGP